MKHFRPVGVGHGDAAEQGADQSPRQPGVHARRGQEHALQRLAQSHPGKSTFPCQLTVNRNRSLTSLWTDCYPYHGSDM